jgi:prepilin-type N-terminal cleavage/methylation domain-containing protein
MMIPKQKLPSPPSTQSGFTLIECLLAIIIVAVLLVAVAPALVLSVATRVQARRVELATQSAQTYIDGLRAGKIPPPPYGVVIKPIPNQPGSYTSFLNSFTPPRGGVLTCPTPPTPATLLTPVNYYCKDAKGYPYLYCVDLDDKPNLDGNCTRGDYLVQGFRSFIPMVGNPSEPDPSDNGSLGYTLGIRVYRADAMNINGDLKTTVDPQDPQGRSRKVATFTGGAGDRSAPLVETTTEIRPAQSSYESLKQRLGLSKSGGAVVNPGANP